MTEQLSKVYEPKTLESRVNEIWVGGRYFHAEASADGGKGKKNYTIVIPPPNVTAALHLGHALNNTLQDVLIRFHRMQQYNTLWMPGTDHAGIATQTVVEKRILAEENKKRTDFKREDFIARVQAWKDEYEVQIIGQLKAMGCSCDWERTRFTMDETCAKAVRATFFKLFKDGLIYRGKRLVNWDPATQTVLADDEVEHQTVQGHFWYMRYPLVEPVEIEGKRIEYVTVATTRPETMLGDTAIAMNPSDGRAKYLVGKKVRLPIVGRIIPIIADEHVVLPNPDSEDVKAKFSTGFLKVTPAHDPDDWEIGQRHRLEVINIMAPDGSISDRFGWDDATEAEAQSLIGLDRFEAREAVIEWFREEHLLEDVKEYAHEIGHSYRSHVPIEPYLSDQWYIAVKKPIPHLAEKFGEGLIENTDVPINSLAGLALKPLLDGRLRFIPERYAKTYQSWLENLRDWPISRQLWWGHRIPIWYCQKCGQINSGITDPKKCDKCGSNDLVQDTDVLDTWFSSALWPFSTLGWPDETPEFKTFYPGDVLCTAREIITLWVSRMVMMGQYCAGDIPFKDVFIHAMIQDGEGRKMSKSLGNGIDPLVAIDSHGADAMRFTLASMTTDTQDVRMPVEQMKLPDGRTANTSPKFDIGRNFCNKLWNASRFAMMNLEGIEPEKFDKARMTITDRWILSRMTQTIAETTKSLEEFKFSEPLMVIYKFFWNDLCDWYLEWIKPRMQDKEQKPTAQNILAFVLDQTLRLLHPFVPFITEGIFQKLNEISPVRKLNGIADSEKSAALVIALWPKKIDSLIDTNAEKQIDITQAAVRAIRDLRSQYNKVPSEKLTASANSPQDVADILNQNAGLICHLAGLKEFSASRANAKPKNAAATIVEQMQIYLHEAIDPQAEHSRLEKQKEQLEKLKSGIEAKLENPNFVNKARADVVEQTRGKLAEIAEQLRTIEKHLLELKG
ncbi:MAG: valine--tRNA ligase [Planctomycetota bacterium]|nr:valine--tRNA ligase [Planctomycetota bacterium]